MKYLTAGFISLLLVILTITDASALSITLTKSVKPETEVDFESCYQQLLKEEESRAKYRRSVDVDVPDLISNPQPLHNCADLFERLYEQFKAFSVDHDHPNLLSKAYYDFLLTDEVIATVRAKINKNPPTTEPPATTVETTHAITGAATTTAAPELTTNSFDFSELEDFSKTVPAPDIEVVYTDAQIKALIVNVAHILMTSTWSLNHRFCSGPFLSDASYLGCQAVMARYFLSHKHEYDYFVLTPGHDSEARLRQWVDSRSIENPPTFLVTAGHVNLMNTVNLEYFRGIVGMPDLVDDHFDPMQPLTSGERAKLSTHTGFKSDCETFRPGDMTSLFCNHARNYLTDHGNGLLFGDNPSICGVDIEATLHRTRLAYQYQDKVSEPGEDSRSYPAYLIHSRGNNSSTLINSHIRLHIEPEQTRTFSKNFNYLPLSPPVHHDHDVYLFYNNDVIKYIFSKNTITLDSCSDSFGGFVLYTSASEYAPRIQLGNRVEDVHGNECMPDVITTTGHTSTTTDSPLTKVTTPNNGATAPVGSLFAITLAALLIFLNL